MKRKKKRKQGKVRPRARRPAWSIHAKRRASVRKQSVESKAAQWLRIIPDRREHDLDVHIASGASFFEHNPSR